MRLWKIAIAVMLLTSSALGAVNVHIYDYPGASQPGTAEITLSVSSDIALGAIGIYINCNKPNAAKVTAQTALDPAMAEKVTSDPSTLGFIASGDRYDFANYTGSYGLLAPGAAGTTRQGDFTTLTITLSPGVTGPLYLTFVGDWASSLQTGAQSGMWPMVTIPEPASMLLLAAGAAFFARRRRV